LQKVACGAAWFWPARIAGEASLKGQMMITLRARNIATAALLMAVLAGMAACSREQQDWRAAEGADTMESYGQFIEHHPDSELVKAARARVAQLGENFDWSEAAKADSAQAYLQFLAKHPDGKWAQEARIRAQNFALAATTQAEAAPSSTAAANAAPPATEVPEESAVPAAGAVPVSSPSPAQLAYGIQLGAFTSEDRANAEWRTLQARFAEQLQGLAPEVVAAETASGRVFRLQALAGDESRARLICEQLRQHSQGCVPVVPH
jgi:cell division septation protein DedD